MTDTQAGTADAIQAGAIRAGTAGVNRSAAPAADPVDLLARAVSYTTACLGAVTAADLDRPTPCARWSLRELLAHMNESFTILEEAVLDRAVLLMPATLPVLGADPAAALRERAQRTGRSWRRVGDRGSIRVGDHALSVEVTAAAGAFEVVVHGWDVAYAVGRPRPIPDRVATELLSWAEVFVTDADRPGRFAQPVPVSSGSRPGDRLIAATGRVGSP